LSTDDMTPAYARQVGERFRHIRKQQRLSLQAVEENSGREFKASVLGAYERGERIISVLRLQALAGLYGVPVDQLLPRHSAEPDLRVPTAGRVTIDLSRLAHIEGPERQALQHYVAMIQLQRGDFNGRMITIRSDDVSALGRVFERSESSMRERLRELGICD
jgi:transcriptional regulator with XRE-family HTH domain